MKLYIKGKVYQVDPAREEIVLSKEREVATYRSLCESRNTPTGPTESTILMRLRMNCCTKPMHLHFQKKFHLDKAFKLTMQLDNGQEVRGKIQITHVDETVTIHDPIPTLEYKAIFRGKVYVTTPIDWTRVENAHEDN